MSNDNFGIKIYDINESIINQQNFTGQKLLHCFNTEHIYKQVMNKKTKKEEEKSIGTRYINEFCSNDMKNAIETGRYFIKFDGGCGFIKYDEEKKKFIPYTRIDVKPDKKTNKFEEKNIDDTWIPCEPKPTHKNATHWPHFRPCVILDNEKCKEQLKMFIS